MRAGYALRGSVRYSRRLLALVQLRELLQMEQEPGLVALMQGRGLLQIRREPEQELRVGLQPAARLLMPAEMAT